MFLPDQAVDLRVHIVGYVNYLGIAFVGALREDHLYKLRDDVDVRVLQIALLQRTHSTATSRSVRDGVARGCGLFQEVIAD